MDSPLTSVRRNHFETTCITFFKNSNEVQLTVDPEWSSVLRPSIHDRIAIGTCDRHPGVVMIFPTPGLEGKHSWQLTGNQGALRIRFHTKQGFEWCRSLLPDIVEYIPTEIEPLLSYPGIRGITIDWPGWVEVIEANLSSDVTAARLRTQIDSMRTPPEIFPTEFMDGTRLLY